ncbi:hypothetical protein ACIA7R_31470 [Micromonospora chalcea]
MADVIAFPGVGSVPAPGPRAVPADLDGMGERYVAYCEARVEALRVELADELDRLRGGA